MPLPTQGGAAAPLSAETYAATLASNCGGQVMVGRRANVADGAATFEPLQRLNIG